MSEKAQIRFVVKYAGELVRLMSMSERKGGVLITTHMPGALNRNEEKIVQEKHISIHPSSEDKNGNNTVHATTEFPDGKKLEIHLSSAAVRKGNCQLIMARSVSHLGGLSLKGIRKGAKGEVVELPPYNPDRCTLAYQIWFCSHDIAKRAVIRSDAYRLWTRQFPLFTVFVPFCFLPAPSTIRGTSVHTTSTSEERWSDEYKKAGIPPGETDGNPPEEVKNEVIWRFNHLLGRREWFGLRAFEGPDTEGPQLPNFSPFPIT
jgi:hypothetical protein